MGVNAKYGTSLTPPMAWVGGYPVITRRINDITDRDVYGITAYRCSACGFLEFYATAELIT